MPILDELMSQYERDGYFTIQLLDAGEVALAQREVAALLPTWETFDSNRGAHPAITARGLCNLEFPFPGEVLHRAMFHPDIIEFAERRLQTGDVLMSRSVLSNKYAGTVDFDQGMHLDYGNNDMAFPAADGAYAPIAVILYLTDVTEDFSPTAVVAAPPKENLHLPGWLEGDAEAAQRAREVMVTGPAGTALVYGMRTLHRGTRMTASQGIRTVLASVYTTAAARWQQHGLYPRRGDNYDGQAFADFILRATPRERALVGFPALGSPYWTDETLAGVERRYPGFDPEPYRAAVSRPVPSSR